MNTTAQLSTLYTYTDPKRHNASDASVADGPTEGHDDIMMPNPIILRVILSAKNRLVQGRASP